MPIFQCRYRSEEKRTGGEVEDGGVGGVGGSGGVVGGGGAICPSYIRPAGVSFCRPLMAGTRC